MKQPTVSGKFAILTAVSPNLWVDFKLFLHSLREHCHHDLYVVDLGLLDDQRDFLKKQKNVVILHFDVDSANHLRQNWPQWAKPYYFNLLPNDIDYLLWIDVDTIILQSLGPLFAQATTGFFVLTDQFAPSSCINDDQLYARYSTSIDNRYKSLALNSGVIGLALHREEDRKIIVEWQELTNIVQRDPDIVDYIKLYDQGVLLWVIHKLQKFDCVLDIKEWNYPAKRNPYNLYENSYNWQAPDAIGGNIFDNIRYDNQAAIIAHYAGLPKLSNLLEIDDKTSITNFRNRRGTIPQKRLFVVGLERSGTHTIAEAIRRSAKVETWVRHEYLERNGSGVLAIEAYKKFHREANPLNCLYRRLKLYSRNDCAIICESNHRLAFFIPEILRGLNGDCKFILMLRDPVALIRSRLYNFSAWLNSLSKYPGSYQYDIHRGGSNGFNPCISEFNLFRITPEDDLDIIGMHIWEICTTLNIIFTDTLKSGANLITIWLEQATIASKTLHELCRPNLDINILQHHLKIKYGAHNGLHSSETIDWVESLITQNSQRITDAVYSVLTKHRCKLPNFV